MYCEDEEYVRKQSHLERIPKARRMSDIIKQRKPKCKKSDKKEKQCSNSSVSHS